MILKEKKIERKAYDDVFREYGLDRKLEIQTEKYPSKIIVKEEYCTNQNCNCREVDLEFYKLFEENNTLEILFTVCLDLNTYKMKDKRIFDNSINADDIIDEFIDSIEDKEKQHFEENYKEAKEGKKLIPIEKEVKEQILDETCVLYMDIFDNVNTIQFKFDDNNYILIYDYYCMNPKCDCNETFITFIRVDGVSDNIEELFGLKYSLGIRNMEIEFQNCEVQLLKDIMTIFREKEINIRNTLKLRYKEMKEVGSLVYRENNNTPLVATKNSKVGRNDKCPCGSGKKYKHCCEK